MRVIFFGTPEFAASILDHLIQNKVEIVAVVTQMDKPQKRSEKKVPSAVKQVAIKHRIPLFQPQRVKDPLFIEEMGRLDPDVFIVVAFGQIFPKALLDVPKKAAINVHASLLPLYRGAAPMQRCLMDGCAKTGITIQHMAEKMDAGDIILQKEIDIKKHAHLKWLHDALCKLSKPLLLKALKKLDHRKAQNEKKATYAPKIEKKDLILDFTKQAKQVLDHILALSPIPTAYCMVEMCGPKRLKVFAAKMSKIKLRPKEILIDKERFLIGSQTNAIELLVVQLEGKIKMSSKDFLKGVKNRHFQII